MRLSHANRVERRNCRAHASLFFRRVACEEAYLSLIRAFEMGDPFVFSNPFVFSLPPHEPGSSDLIARMGVSGFMRISLSLMKTG